MEKEYLIDTNTFIEYLGETLPEKSLKALDKIIDSRFYISVINRIELLGFSNISITEEEKINDFIEYSYEIDLSGIIADKTIELRKQYKIKLPDAVIAASAIIYDLTLLTRNIKDFVSINELKIQNSHEL
jgi:predicted nucleic acid-binding protein